MKPAAFEYVVADSVEMAVAALAEAGGEAKIIAGGQSLVPMLNFRLLRPAILVDINRIPDLAYVREDHDVIRIVAAATVISDAVMITRRHVLSLPTLPSQVSWPHVFCPPPKKATLPDQRAPR